MKFALIAWMMLWALPVYAQSDFERSPFDDTPVKTCVEQNAKNIRDVANNDLHDSLVDCIGTSVSSCEKEFLKVGIFPKSECVAFELKWWDSLLNIAYKERMVEAKESPLPRNKLLKSDPEALRDMQRTWIAYRDATCEFVYLYFGGGTAGPTAETECLLDLTARQAIFLKSYWLWFFRYRFESFAEYNLIQHENSDKLVVGQVGSKSVDQQKTNELVFACFDTAERWEQKSKCKGQVAELCMKQDRQWGGSTVGMTLCQRAEANGWIAIIDRELGLTLDAFETSDEIDRNSPEIDLPYRAPSLRETHEIWLAFKAMRCTTEFAKYRGGTMRSIMGASCELAVNSEHALFLWSLRQN